MKSKKSLLAILLAIFVIVIAGCPMVLNNAAKDNTISADETPAQAAGMYASYNSYGEQKGYPTIPIKGKSYYVLDRTAVTQYKCFHVGLETLHSDDEDDQMILKKPDKDDIVTLRDENLYILKYPGTNTPVKMTKWRFWKCHLEGSAFLPYNGKTYILNLRKPDPQVTETDPTTAAPERAGFKIFSYVDWGLDALPASSNGLVPWRTAAISLESYKIPAGVWVYIPSLDGKVVPVPRINDLGDGKRLWDPAKASDHDHFDWITHDGWVKTTDISWSLPTWMPIEDGKWMDLFIGTDTIMRWLWDHPFTDESIPGNKEKEYTKIQVYPYADVPVLVTNDGIKYQYTEVTSSDPFLISKVYNHPLSQSIDFPNIYKLIFASDGDSVTHDVLYTHKNNYFYMAQIRGEHPNITATKLRWSEPMGASGATPIYGDFDGDGNADWVCVQGGRGSDDVKIYNSWGKTTTITVNTNQHHTYISGGTVGDFDGDGKDELAVRIVYSRSRKLYIYKLKTNNQFEKQREINLPAYSGFNCGESADFNGDGYDDILYTTRRRYYGLEWMDIRTGEKHHIAQLKSGSAYQAMYIDPDNKADIILSIPGEGTYKLLSSHIRYSPWEKISDQAARIVSHEIIKVYHK